MNRLLGLVAAAVLSVGVHAAEFATPGGPEPANLGEVLGALRRDAYDLELLVSYGTSKGGSAGHLALAIRDAAPGDDLVYSANFYADRDPAHERDFHTRDLMVRIPKREYLYGTASTVDAKASFGLDYGEAYKRSVIGIRAHGVPAAEKEALAAYLGRINGDYHARARGTEYHTGEVRYGYLTLNCAKTIGSAFRYGAGYADLDIRGAWIFEGIRLVAALTANTPSGMATKIVQQWSVRGYGVDVVLYRKYPGSPYVDPRDGEPVAFRDLPDRFPSVISRDFRNDEGEYRDYDNLYIMYLLYNLGRHVVRVDEATKRLVIDASKHPLDYAEAARLAAESAQSDSTAYEQRLAFRPRGHRVGEGEGEGAPGR